MIEYNKQLLEYKNKNDHYEKLINKNNILIESNCKIIEIKRKKLNKLMDEFILI